MSRPYLWVAAASLGHLLYGDFRLSLTMSLLVGAIPGVYAGARASAAAPGGVVRRALAMVLIASGLKLLGAPTLRLFWILLGVVIAGPLVWMWVRTRYGLPALARWERSRSPRRDESETATRRQ